MILYVIFDPTLSQAVLGAVAVLGWLVVSRLRRDQRRAEHVSHFLELARARIIPELWAYREWVERVSDSLRISPIAHDLGLNWRKQVRVAIEAQPPGWRWALREFAWLPWDLGLESHVTALEDRTRKAIETVECVLEAETGAREPSAMDDALRCLRNLALVADDLRKLVEARCAADVGGRALLSQDSLQRLEELRTQGRALESGERH